MIGDLITIDREDEPIMVVKIDVGKPGPEALQSFTAEFEGMEPPLPFGMFVDLDEIVILERRDGDLQHPPTRLSTSEILKLYAPEFAGRDTPRGSPLTFRNYFTTLVEAWLRDYAFHWKSKEPPGSEDLTRIGLAQRLEGGFTESHARASVIPLY
jgi:hypothetical protein